jgi:hypothetical protein
MMKYLLIFFISLNAFSTEFKIKRVADINSEIAKIEFVGFTGTATASTTTNIQYKTTVERWIDAAKVILKDHCYGDKLNFQVVDVDNVLGLGAGTVLNQFGTDLYVSDSVQDQGWFESPYTALIPANIYIRIAYTSTCGTNVKVSPILRTHKPNS